MTRKGILIVAVLAALALAAAITTIDLATQVHGTLVVANGGTGNTAAGTAGQPLIADGSGHFTPQDPIVSFNYANLWTAQDITATRTSSLVRVSTFGGYGTLFVTFAGITGSPVSCTIQIKSADSAGNLVNNGSAIAATVSNGSSSQQFIPASTIPTNSQMEAVWACGTYPTAGTLTLEFVPAMATAVWNSITLQANASVNLNQVGGNAVAADSSGRQILKTYPDTTTTSYHASSKFAASSTTDNAVMPGNATNTVLVTKITVTCTETTAGQINIELLKRSTADSAGTAANLTVVPDDANYAAGVSVPKSYTGTGPTVGTPIGDLDNAQIGCMASATATPNDIYVFRPLKPIVLRGTAQMITVNVGNAALTGGNLTVTFDYMETTTP